MANISMKQLLEAGVHFGHQTRRWNPKMARYIYGERNGIYIVDLQKTVKKLKEVTRFVKDLVATGEKIIFVGTKKQAKDSIQEEAARCGMFYMNHRWLGGTLTNFQTIRKTIERMKSLERMLEDGSLDSRSKKERQLQVKELAKMQRSLSGIRDLEKLPGAIFVVDSKKEHNAILEARRLGIPIIGIVDTNCDPDEVDYIIPGNDDAIRAVRLIASIIADSVLEGRELIKVETVAGEEMLVGGEPDAGQEKAAAVVASKAEEGIPAGMTERQAQFSEDESAAGKRHRERVGVDAE